MPNEHIELIKTYCTKTWGNSFFEEYLFDASWTGASDEKKVSALKAATDFINLYVMFYDEDGNAIFYVPDGTDDYDDDIIPRKLKQACAQEAAYLLSLDDNPAEPHPLTILGLLRGDFGTIDKSLVPPIFPRHVIRLLELMGGEVDTSAIGDQEFGVKEKRLTQ